VVVSYGANVYVERCGEVRFRVVGSFRVCELVSSHSFILFEISLVYSLVGPLLEVSSHYLTRLKVVTRSSWQDHAWRVILGLRKGM
jgi:hypothetical protein